MNRCRRIAAVLSCFTLCGAFGAAEPPRFAARVTDAATGHPIAGSEVNVERLIRLDPRIVGERTIRTTSHTTDAAGRYSFALDPAEEVEPYLEAVVRIKSRGYLPVEMRLPRLHDDIRNARLGDRLEFDVALDPGTAITGLVVGPDGQPVAGAVVTAISTQSIAGKPSIKNQASDRTRTDASGRFAAMVLNPSDVQLHFAASRYALLTAKLPAGQRGDVGRFVLRDGLTVRGRVLDAAGQPIAGVPVRAYHVAQPSPAPQSGLWDTHSTDLERWTLTAADGSFAVPPLPLGIYKVIPAEQGGDPVLGFISRPVPVPFLPVAVTLRAGQVLPSVTLVPMPHVAVEAHIMNSQHQPIAGPGLRLGGSLSHRPPTILTLPRRIGPEEPVERIELAEPISDGDYWSATSAADETGVVVWQVPRGLRVASIGLTSFLGCEQRSYRWRLGPDGPWQGGDSISLDRSAGRSGLGSDRRGIEIMAYDAPVVLASVRARDGSKLAEVQVMAAYGRFPGPDDGQAWSALRFHPQADGRFRSRCLLPDEAVTITATAAGFRPQAATLTLPEGAVVSREMVLDR